MKKEYIKIASIPPDENIVAMVQYGGGYRWNFKYPFKHYVEPRQDMWLQQTKLFIKLRLLNNMENAIKKAIEGGYRNHEINLAYFWCGSYENICPFINGYKIIQYRTKENKPDSIASSGTPTQPVEIVLLDPLFWQCLGKQQGWGCNCNNGHIFEGYEPIPEEDGGCSQGDPIWGGCSVCVSNGQYTPAKDWKDYWHDFIDHIAEGKSVDSFFEQVLK